MSGAGTPSKSTLVPPSVVFTKPAVRRRVVNEPGPNPVPNKEMISPGATGPERKLAALTRLAGWNEGTTAALGRSSLTRKALPAGDACEAPTVVGKAGESVERAP